MKVEIHESRTLVIEAGGKAGIQKAMKKIASLNEKTDIDSFSVTTIKSIFTDCKTIKP